MLMIKINAKTSVVDQGGPFGHVPLVNDQADPSPRPPLSSGLYKSLAKGAPMARVSVNKLAHPSCKACTRV